MKQLKLKNSIHVFNSIASKVQERNVELEDRSVRKRFSLTSTLIKRQMWNTEKSLRAIEHIAKESSTYRVPGGMEREDIILATIMVKNLPTLTKKKILEAANMIDT